MLGSIISDIKTALANAGVTNVYSAFDALRTDKKGDFFSVVGISGFETNTPVYSHYYIFIPFRATAEISVTAPEKFPLERLYSYYDENIMPVINSLSGLTAHVSGLTIKHDTNINRLVLNVKFHLTGMKKIERENI